MHFQKKSLAVAVTLAFSAPLAALAAPTVSWQAPANGAVIAGSLTGSACAVATSSSATRVTFWANSWQINNDYSPPFNCNFPTTSLKDGAYTLKAVAYDATGASTTSSINVTIKNGTTTTTTTTNAAPSVSLTAPTTGQTVSGTIGLSAIAADDHGVSNVVFMVDSTTIATDTTSPYSTSLNTTTLANGTHVVKA